MTRISQLIVFGFISLLSCKSVNKTVDKEKISQTTQTKVLLTGEKTINTQILSQEEFKRLNVTLEAQADSVTFEKRGNKIVITGAKTIKLNSENGTTNTKTETNLLEKSTSASQAETETETERTNRDVSKKGIPTGAIVGLCITGLLAISVLIYSKKPTIFSGISNFLTIFKPKKND